MQNISVLNDGSFALRAQPYSALGIHNVYLAANVPKWWAVPATCSHVFFSANEDFYAFYTGENDSHDVVTNGAFASDASWTKGDGWTIATGVADSDGTQIAASLLSQNVSTIGGFTLVENVPYYVTYTVTRSAGGVTPVIGGTSGTARTSAATFSEYIVAGSTQVISFSADTSFVGTVDNVSVIPAARVPAADNLEGSGSELNPTVRWVKGLQYISLVSAATNAVITINAYRS